MGFGETSGGSFNQAVTSDTLCGENFLDAPVYDSPASLKSVSHPRVENVVVQVVISEAAELFLPTAVGEIVEVLWAPHLAAVF